LVVPKGVAFKYIQPESYKQQMKRLIQEGKVVNPLFYKPDHGFKRTLSLFKSQLGHYVKFKKYI
jgi:D-aspartate ligase